MSEDLHLRETTVERTELLKGHFLHVVRDTGSLPSGKQASREYVLHPGATMIIGLLDDGQIVLERQYRHPLGRVLIEFPAGKKDRGENSLLCAQREFHEETGYRARQWAFAGRLAPTAAYADETLDIWFARGLSAGSPRLDEGEFLEVFSATPEQLQSWCRDGSIIDSKTLVGALWLHNLQSGAWTPDWSGAEPGKPKA